MSLLTVLILSASLFVLFLLLAFINICISARQAAKHLDKSLGQAGAMSFSGIVGTAAEMVNRGMVKVAIHIVCGILAALSGLTFIVAGVLYLVQHCH